MSNKQQLQTNNTKYASLIETLRGKAAGGSGEDVTEETSAYTTKISQLETAVTALETELAGKASGGSGGNSFVQVTNSPYSISNFLYVNSDYQYIDAIPGQTVNVLGGIIWIASGVSVSLIEGTAQAITSIGGDTICVITSDSANVLLGGSGGGAN